jgi:formamidopyrimidine-DNA glycosylase
VRELRRVGKRIAIGLDGDLWLVLHLMIAGRLHWKPAHAALSGRRNLAAFDFPPGSLTLTEAGSKRRIEPSVLSRRGWWSGIEIRCLVGSEVSRIM